MVDERNACTPISHSTVGVTSSAPFAIMTEPPSALRLVRCAPILNPVAISLAINRSISG